MSIIGFARVSASEQELTLQLAQLEEVGCDKIFSGQHSGASTINVEKLNELINYIRSGDVVLVTKLDRLGRSLKSILTVIDQIHAKGASLRSIDGAIDTSNDFPMAKAVVNLLGAFAQLERDLIVSRTREGREKAMAEGKVFGRPRQIDVKCRNAIKKNQTNNISELAKKYGVSRTTINRIKREEK
jgi:DNA invertase Pin-like site-specific DNA recombinase